MGLSSNTIIHFTKSLVNLKGILTDNFKIKYCRETIVTKSKTHNLLFPIISFCDIPFSQIMTHVNSYGHYGIGLKKSWAEEKGLNPVLYLDKGSSLAEHIFTRLYEKLKVGKSKISEFSPEERYLLDFMRYLKNYQGDLSRTGKKTIKNYRFSDEREWRYVLDPSLEYPLFGTVPDTLLNDEPRYKAAKKEYSEKLQKERLIFTPEDVNYIIISKESERTNIIDTLEKVSGKYPHEQVKRLISRIISVDQLKTDF
jgi:Putative abortive phage resistance protein AbiGi, antitoxin